LLQLLLFIGGLAASLALVIKSADIFVDNIVEIGTNLGISEIILGVTASAVGTSLPEFGSAMMAILTGNPDIGVGVAVGANIWNIGGILGISTIVTGVLTAQKEELHRDGLMTLLTAVVLAVSIYFLGNISRVLGIVLIAMYIIYFWVLIRAHKNHTSPEKEDTYVDLKDKKSILSKKSIFWAVLGLIGLAVGCRIIVYCTVELSAIANISAGLAGILLAFGTTTPEFFTVLTSARKGLNSLAIGTVFGSNIFNILIGLGIPSIIVQIPVDPSTIYFNAPVMVLITILLLVLIKQGMKLTRIKGIILAAFYIAYIVTRLLFIN
jgi:cation:H+ antiporter